MKLTLRTKLILSLGILVGLGLCGLSLYLRGKRVGVAENVASNIKAEVVKLEEEKVEISKEVYALDNDALYHRILSLSSRVHREATKRVKGLPLD